MSIDKNHLKSVAISGLFKYLPQQEYITAWQELNMNPRIYAPQQVIYGQEEPVHRAAIVHSGLVKGERLHMEGTANLAYYYAPGDILAFEGAVSGKRTSPMQITAESQTTVIFFDVNKIVSASCQQPLIQGLMELLANDDIKKLYRIDILSKKGIRDRILTYFQVLASKGDGHSFHLNMSREQLAKYLCVNRSALSYELNKMKKEGLIKFEGKKFTLTI